MDRTITATIKVVLPIDDDERPPAALAPALASVGVGRIGAVDNGLWRSMPVLLRLLEAEMGAPLVERLPFDHLSPHFDEQQRALGPFATRVAGAVTGLGN
jgi:hypothetical protein